MIDVLINAGIGAVRPEIFLLVFTIFLLLYGLYNHQYVRTPFIVPAALLVLMFTGYLVIGLFNSIISAIFSLTLVFILIFDLVNLKKKTGFFRASFLSSVVSLVFFIFVSPIEKDLGCTNDGVFLGGMFASNAFTVFAKVLILLSGGFVLMLSSGFLREEGGRPFEFIILLLFSLLGMMLMISAADLLSLYMALEMSSLALYVLASFNRDNTKSSEAGLKYFVLGALASGMMLYGMSLVYGFAGSTSFAALGDLFAGQSQLSKGVVLGLILMMVGFCFKLSAVPFHMWTPDVYEGAPTPVTAFFATAPKIAALALFTRLLLEPFANAVNQWQQIIIFVSVASMLVGAFGAITQTNIKRLMAYSSIGYVGFLFMALAAGNASGVQSMLIYMSLYIFMCASMFGAVLLMKRDGKAVENIKDLSGVSQTNPALAVAVSISIFSMAGIPPLSGFFGKMYVLLAAVEANLTWLAVVGVITSVVSCYYYLKIIKTMYFDEPAPAFDGGAPFLVNAAIVIGAVVTMLFFLVPSPLIVLAKTAASSLLLK